VSQRRVLASYVALALLAAGCLATKPYVRTEVQKSDAQMQHRLQAVEHRLDAVERDVDEEKARVGILLADVHQIRAAVGETAKLADQARELIVKSEAQAAAPPRVSAVPSAQTPAPVAGTAETLVVQFRFGESQLDKQGRLTLLRAVKRLQDDPALVVKLEGHADSIGSPTKNLELSQRRADEVRRFLLEHGIKRGRIEALAIGEARPIASNRSPAGRDQNRRVAITLVTPTK